MNFETVTASIHRGKSWMKALLMFMMALITAMPSAFAKQRDFPTGEPNSTVTYLDAGGPGHPTGCVVSIFAGLPTLGISFSFFSNNSYTTTVVSLQNLSNISPGGSSTIKINSIYLFSTVKTVNISNSYYIVQFSPAKDSPIKSAYAAINQITFTAARIDAVADDSLLPSVTIPAEPGLGTALEACERYLLDHL